MRNALEDVLPITYRVDGGGLPEAKVIRKELESALGGLSAYSLASVTAVLDTVNRSSLSAGDQLIVLRDRPLLAEVPAAQRPLRVVVRHARATDPA